MSADSRISGRPDQDHDEVSDRVDICPTIPQGPRADQRPQRIGCSSGDRDNDGNTGSGRSSFRQNPSVRADQRTTAGPRCYLPWGFYFAPLLDQGAGHAADARGEACRFAARSGGDVGCAATLDHLAVLSVTLQAQLVAARRK